MLFEEENIIVVQSPVSYVLDDRTNLLACVAVAKSYDMLVDAEMGLNDYAVS